MHRRPSCLPKSSVVDIQGVPPYPPDNYLGEYPLLRQPRNYYVTASEQQQLRQQREASYIQQTMEMQSARNRAEKLLLRLLTPEQQGTYRRRGYFHIVGSEGDKFQIFCDSLLGNVSLLDDHLNRVADYCAHPRPYDLAGRGIPIYDLLIGQMLALKTNQMDFIRTANLMSVHYIGSAVGDRIKSILAVHNTSIRLIRGTTFA